MKDLYEYLRYINEEDAGAPAGAATPGSVMGMGNPDPSVDGFISAPAGGIPHENTRIFRRRKKSKKNKPDFDMKDNDLK